MESVEERIARLERQVADLQRYLGIDPERENADGPFLPPEFYEALRRGKKILAIKIYREQTGASLLEAKNTVDTMALQQR
ncbi:hypothetical protein ETD86_21135 [Nonomuraea turkmeniaca]|uniref:Ribosomal protein L7/L12 C-terminal domain-containing protein n=2 Tax=Nonomuraea turkmeniaca TaxID=103838 RepID=A0A5S4FGI8_9ACTN|nr:hypothetical protein ETD86_21135 [Nonomuraea turkmeniaca]